MIVVIGASGVGKDSVLSGARQLYSNDSRVDFLRRHITRPINDGAEHHQPLDNHQFDQMLADGAFAVHWRANQLSYGISVGSLHKIAQGQVLVMNGSRQALASIASVYPSRRVVLVSADANLLRQRMVRRNRDSAEQIEKRLARQSKLDDSLVTDHIDNSGELGSAINALADIIQQQLAPDSHQLGFG